MSQFFFEKSNQFDSKQKYTSEASNKIDYSLQPESNLVFSPRSEENSPIDNIICQSIPSPMVSFNQPFSPYEHVGILSGDVLQMNIFNNNSPNFPDQIFENPTENKTFGNRFKLPITSDNFKSETNKTELINEPKKEGFNRFCKVSSNELKNFLQDQIINDKSKPILISPIDIPLKPITKVPQNDPKTEEVEEQESYQDFESSNSKQYSLKDQKECLINPKFITFFSALFGVFVENKLDIEIYNNLSYFHRLLFFHLVKRKFFPKANKEEKNQGYVHSVENLLQIMKTNSVKRPEECYKFVLTRVLKFLKHNIQNTIKCKTNIEEKLYEIYFLEVSKRYRVPLSEYHYPLTGNLKGKFKLNSKYFSKIFKSEVFNKAVFDYCEKHLILEYSQDINKKLTSLINKWSDDLDNPDQNLANSERKIMDYVMHNKRCKLPWSIPEIKESIDKFYKLIEYYKPDGKESKRRKNVKKDDGFDFNYD